MYEKSWVAVDAAIFTINKGKLKIVLHDREKEPYKSKKELPGGLILKNETAEDTLKRKLKNLVGNEKIFFTQFHTFTEITRDPRERAVSIGYIALINNIKSKELNWHEVQDLPKLAFDHNKMIKKAQEYLKENISALIVRQFLPEKFPLNKLQEAYELIEEIKYDNRNFRKQMINSGIVEETKEMEKDVSHRPARLYKFKR